MNIKIKFKNGSYIVPVESKDNMRSKRAEEQLSKQFQYYENDPIAFAEKYLGINLMWYQKMYLRLMEKLK